MRIPTFAVALVLAVASCGGAQPASTSTTSTADAPSTTIAEGPTTTPTTTETTSSTAEPFPTDVGDLLVVGDWGSGTMPQGAVAGAMSRYAEDHDLAAILTTGDNFYSDDREFLMEPFGWATEADIPFWVAWGNHDLDTDARVEAMDQVFDDPPRWTIHEWGAIDVVILDSTQPESSEQLDFLTTTLAEGEDPTIVVFHHPPYSCGSHGETEMLDEWVEAFDEDVFLVLSGHEHNYQRFEEGGVTYVVTGGGGASLTELTTCPNGGHPSRIKGHSLHHFIALSQDERATATVFDVNGNVIDQWEMAYR